MRTWTLSFSVVATLLALWWNSDEPTLVLQVSARVVFTLAVLYALLQGLRALALQMAAGETGGPVLRGPALRAAMPRHLPQGLRAAENRAARRRARPPRVIAPEEVE